MNLASGQNTSSLDDQINLLNEGFLTYSIPWIILSLISFLLSRIAKPNHGRQYCSFYTTWFSYNLTCNSLFGKALEKLESEFQKILMVLQISSILHFVLVSSDYTTNNKINTMLIIKHSF